MTMDLDLKSDRRPSKPLDSPGGGPLAYYAGGKTPRNKPRSIVGRVLRICAAMMVILSLLFFVTTSQYSSTAAQSYTPNTEQDVAELMAWITACGGFISPKIDIKLMSTKHGMMRGLFAMDYISTDATLLKVPNTCLLNSANLRVRLTDSDRVILMLMLENRKREQSHFLPYLKVLWPIQWESPDTWSWLQWFMAPSVMKSVATSWLEHWDGGFARIKGYCARLPSWEDSSGGMTCAQFTKAEYYQAIRWTGSRTFTVDTEEGSMKLMVPVLDMLNHEAEETGAQNVAYSFPGQSEGGGAILKSIKPLVPGDELIIPYFATGTHCREEQLLKYGFHNEAAIPCPETYSPDQGLEAGDTSSVDLTV
eukprot:CAMPEP_0197859922 /NCGR_PEP_ID=MMETSP1438-20131217/34923_1 /TAXON_ID=1461541 /ORGANISM="Pterosperma sp., Strain CCMP1384" /LENGTH=364 /DNA_ID=CAMNT_0043476601 /DNA_START=34 /DNA_END=1129 /DNA_ORIENTATION=+